MYARVYLFMPGFTLFALVYLYAPEFISENMCLLIKQSDFCACALVKLWHVNIFVSFRLAEAKSIMFESVRTPSIMVEVDNDFIYGLLVDEASTRAVNLFAVWMINTLSNACVLTVGFIDSLWYLTPIHSKRRKTNSMGMAEGLDFLTQMFVFLPVLIR